MATFPVSFPTPGGDCVAGSGTTEIEVYADIKIYLLISKLPSSRGLHFGQKTPTIGR